MSNINDDIAYLKSQLETKKKDDTLRLNVGGKIGIKVSKSLLTSVPNSTLEAFFSSSITII